MIQLTADQQQIIRQTAARDAPLEACGFLLADGAVHTTLNIASDPTQAFEIDTASYLLAEDAGLVGIWHSHSTYDGLSPADQGGVRATDLPWVVYTCATDRFHIVDPADRGPLAGRTLCYGINDCYSLVCDYLQRHQGIELPAWPRGAWGEWGQDSFTVFDEQVGRHCRQLGREPLLPGDILLFGKGGRSGHIGVATGPEHFLHHPADEVSREEFFSEAWKAVCRGAWRHGAAQPRWVPVERRTCSSV